MKKSLLFFSLYSSLTECRTSMNCKMVNLATTFFLIKVKINIIMVNVFQNGTSLCTGLSAQPQFILNWQTKTIILYTCTWKQVCVVLIDSNSCPDLCIADKAQRPKNICWDDTRHWSVSLKMYNCFKFTIQIRFEVLTDNIFN